MTGRKKTRFSDYFKLDKGQAQLDFVDIPIETDIPLFVDPYALHVANEDWLRGCGNDVVAYFELLIENIRNGAERAILQLLDNFHEPNETHLGLSSGRPKGRGWGYQQSAQLLSVLRSSAALKSGKLGDLSDYEMFIPGIGPDKISDLTTNIIKNELLLYTQEQCTLLDIPTQRVNPGKCWDSQNNRFHSKYADLPICPSGPIILVPKAAVRTRLIPSAHKFYSEFVLDYLEAELISANDSLVQTLKNGQKKVLRRDLRAKYSFSPEQLFEFGRKHPEILERYKKSLPHEAKPISDLDIEWRQRDQRIIDPRDLGEKLDTIAPGKADAHKFHTEILGLLQVIFYPSLSRPQKEQELDEGRKRLDIKFTNSADSGFFSHLVNKHQVFAPYVFVECKNYREDPENPELEQLKGRMGRKRGHFGLLVCRSIDNPELMLKRCRDIVHNSDEALIIVLEDADIKNLLRLKSTEGEKGVSEYMQSKLDDVLL